MKSVLLGLSFVLTCTITTCSTFPLTSVQSACTLKGLCSDEIKRLIAYHDGILKHTKYRQEHTIVTTKEGHRKLETRLVADDGNYITRQELEIYQSLPTKKILILENFDNQDDCDISPTGSPQSAPLSPQAVRRAQVLQAQENRSWNGQFKKTNTF